MDVLQQISELTKKRVKIDASIKSIEATVKDKLKPLKERKLELDAQAHDLRTQSGQKKISLDEGTWFEKNADKFTVTHKQQMFEWLIEREKSHGDAAEFLEAKVSSTAMKKYMEEAGAAPEWVKYSPAVVTQFRTATKK
jgi:hypothetical protein